MGKKAVRIAIDFLKENGISETKEELWRRFASWSRYIKFSDAEMAAAALVVGDYDVESAYSLSEIKNFYFNGGLAS